MKFRCLDLRTVAGLAATIIINFTATPTFAQLGPPPLGGLANGDGASSGIAEAAGPYLESLRASVRNVTPSRLMTAERLEFEAEDLERRRLEMDDRQIRADIGTQLAKAGVACGVSNFRRIGTTPQAKSIYEAACEAGLGYVLVNGAEPRVTNCIVLAGAAANAVRLDPNARTGAQCALPENQNAVQVIGAWAKQAGVGCKVDEAQWLGSTDDGFDFYEVGCDASEGFWLEKTAASWSLKSCLEVAAEGLRCRFTSLGEQQAWMRARLAGTAAESCNVEQVRLVGVSRQGRHYEASCSEPGRGYIIRTADDGQADRVTPCSEAGRLTISCTLTARSSED